MYLLPKKWTLFVAVWACKILKIKIKHRWRYITTVKNCTIESFCLIYSKIAILRGKSWKIKTLILSFCNKILLPQILHLLSFTCLQRDQIHTPNVYKNCLKLISLDKDSLWYLNYNCLRMGVIWANWLLQKALKICPINRPIRSHCLFVDEKPLMTHNFTSHLSFN